MSKDKFQVRRDNILTAEEIKQKWEAEANGTQWPPPETIGKLMLEKVKLTNQVTDLEEAGVKDGESFPYTVTGEARCTVDQAWDKCGF